MKKASTASIAGGWRRNKKRKKSCVDSSLSFCVTPFGASTYYYCVYLPDRVAECAHTHCCLPSDNRYVDAPFGVTQQKRKSKHFFFSRGGWWVEIEEPKYPPGERKRMDK